MSEERWYLLMSGKGTAAVNMAIDGVLLKRVSELGRPVLRFYSWSEPAASFGYFQHYTEVAKMTTLRPLVRRPTGGGLVTHDRDWTYSVVFPPGHEWYGLRAIESYQRLHEWVSGALNRCGIDASLAHEAKKAVMAQCFSGPNQFDVVHEDQKIAGAAQRRSRDGLLIQGSVQPEPGRDRTLWEKAMLSGRTWTPLEIDIDPEVQSLGKQKYSADSYNQRR